MFALEVFAATAIIVVGIYRGLKRDILAAAYPETGLVTVIVVFILIGLTLSVSGLSFG